MILHFQRALIPMFLIVGNGVWPSPTGTSTKFQIIMDDMTIVNDMEFCLPGYFPFIIENGAMESYIIGLPFSGGPWCIDQQLTLS